MGFGFGFGLIEAVFPLMFLLVFGMFIFIFAKNISQWNKNNRSPRLTVDAVVIDKRGHTSHHNDHHSTSYYVTFEIASSGDRMELHVPGSEYGYLIVGDRGQLTFQGTRFLSFARGDASDMSF